MTGVGSIDTSKGAVVPKYVYPDAFKDGQEHEAESGSVSQRPETFAATHPARERQSEDIVYRNREQSISCTYYMVGDNEICLVSCETTLTSLTLPDSLDGFIIIEMADQCLSSNTKLESLVCPSKVNVLAPHAFDGLHNLEQLVLPRALDYLERNWLQHLESLEKLVLPDNLETVSDMLFNAVQGLQHLVLGAHTQIIEPGMFRFAKLISIEVPESNEFISSDGVCLFSQDHTILIAQAIKSESYEVPQSVAIIGRKAFAYCEEFSSITLPPTLQRIDSYAFAGTSLRSFIAPAGLRSIGERAFFGCSQLEQVELNEGLLFIGTGAFSRTALAELKLPASLEIVEPYAFNISSVACAGGIDERLQLKIDPANTALFIDEDGGFYRREDDGWVFKELLNSTTTNYTLMPGTIRIDERAFLRHPRIQEVSIPEGVITIGTAAFRSCTQLKHVELPSTLTTIQNEAFFETSLESLHIPAALQTLGPVALMTSGVNYNTRPPSLHQITVEPENSKFYTKNGMLFERIGNKTQVVLCFDASTVVTIPSYVTIIAPYAFAGVKNVRRLNIHDNFEVIKNRGLAFAESIDVVHIDLSEPVMEQKSIDAHFPPYERGKRAMLSSFNLGDIDPAFVITCADGSMYWMPDVFERAQWALGRLLNPIFLSPEEKVRFTGLFNKSLIHICKAFAQHGYTDGFDGMIELGFLNKENVSEVVDAVIAEHDAIVSAHVLEVKRQILSTNSFDFEL